MKRIASFVALIAVLGVMSSSSAKAEGSSSVHFGIGGGVALPTGDLKDSEFNTGFHGRASLGIMPAGKNYGLCVDAGFVSLPTDTYVDVETDVTASAKYRALSGDLCALITVPTEGKATPWVKFGVGVYNHKISVDASDGETNVSVSGSETKVGFTGGVGVSFKMSGGKAFGLDASLHSVSSDGTSFVWIPVGVHFMFN